MGTDPKYLFFSEFNRHIIQRDGKNGASNNSIYNYMSLSAKVIAYLPNIFGNHIFNSIALFI
jgi:hypothetical protein